MIDTRLDEQERIFLAKVDKLKLAVSEVLPGTEAERKLTELGDKLTASFQEVRSVSHSKPKPLVVVATESPHHGRWVVAALRKAIDKQLIEPSGNPIENLEGFGPFRPAWSPPQLRFEPIDPHRWNGSQSLSCVTISPHMADRVVANVVLYVVRFEDVQTNAAVSGARVLAGNPIVPVIVNVTENGQRDVEAFVGRLEKVLGAKDPLERIEFPDLQAKRSKVSIADAEAQIWSQCEGFVNVSEESLTRIQAEKCKAIVKQFDTEARNTLRQSDFKKVNQAIRALLDQEKTVLRDQAVAWISVNADDLRVPTRIRLRLIACELTPPLCFPFRSILGALALTTGVWDRFAMGMLGSPVSLALAAYQTGGQLWKNRNSLTELNQQAGEQFSRKVVNELNVPIREARRAIAHDFPGSKALAQVTPEAIHVFGAEALLQEVRTILDKDCRDSVPRRAVLVTAVACTIIFAVMISGPILALYADYLKPLLDVWLGRSQGIGSFPLPEIGRIFTGFMLGVAPGFIAGMILLARLTRHTVIDSLTKSVRQGIHANVDSMINNDSLRLEGIDDSFSQVRVLKEFL